jgi:ParB family chromosome partitioning protein
VALQSLADSIRQYGVLQALVVTRKEVVKPDGGLATEYELIAGERRLRASKLAGIREVPCLIKTGEENNLLKLELAIIENVQREDLNPVDRARSFQRLVEEFGFKHGQIGEKVGKSREYVSNSLRLLTLPSDMLEALSQGKISEGHTRPLLMLGDRKEEQATLFKEIVFRKITVREAEMIARKIAVDKVRKKDFGGDTEITEIESELSTTLGTRVHIEKREVGGKIHIDFFDKNELRMILEMLNKTRDEKTSESIAAQAETITESTPMEVSSNENKIAKGALPMDDRTEVEKKEEENTEDLYSVSNFSI